MSSDLSLHLSDQQQIITSSEWETLILSQASLLNRIKAGETCYSDSLGWLDVAQWASPDALKTIQAKADEIRAKADVFVIIGVGGSNQAARAIITALPNPGGPEILYAGLSISAHYMDQILRQLAGKSVYINVIAKNFETMEPGISFRALRHYLYQQYGDKASERIVATGTTGSHLHQLSQQQGYSFFAFPDDIGGRFTALSTVGLLPMAIAGIDIFSLVQGAQEMQQELFQQPVTENIAVRYAAIRNLLYQKGYRMEMLAFFEPRFNYFAKWWTQLFAESEGKQGKGLYPVVGSYSEDLHSIGQFVQEGTPVLFETFLDVNMQDASVLLPADDTDDRFAYLDNQDFWTINKVAFEATLEAHSAKLPCVTIQVPAINAHTFGKLFYLFEFSCYVSGSMLGVNPFDQPGVEAYKSVMFKKLGK